MATIYQLKRYIITYGDLRINVKEFRNSKDLKVIVHRDCSITITCPPRTSKIKVGKFVEQCADWILKSVKKMQQKPEPAKPYITVFKSKKHELEFRCHEKNCIKVEFSGKLILVKYPKTLDICSTEVQKAAYKAIVTALKSESEEYLPKRLQELATANGLTYKSMSITSTTSKWGCCSNHKDIRISCFVMILPYELIDLVLLHELAHTVHMNHSAAFHKKVNQMLPLHNEKQLTKEIKNYHIIKPK